MPEINQLSDLLSRRRLTIWNQSANDKSMKTHVWLQIANPTSLKRLRSGVNKHPSGGWFVPTSYAKSWFWPTMATENQQSCFKEIVHKSFWTCSNPHVLTIFMIFMLQIAVFTWLDLAAGFFSSSNNVLIQTFAGGFQHIWHVTCRHCRFMNVASSTSEQC